MGTGCKFAPFTTKRDPKMAMAGVQKIGKMTEIDNVHSHSYP